ncbi:MAG: aldehyde dehydrogenase family protein, partial [Oscillospiraceae bacterium]|nr:aldehyde dehydrogenase family protein [Oscillospiraceae bacterium]
GEDPLQNPDYGRIVNEKHFHRLLNLMDQSKAVIGGQSSPETLQIVPTILDRAAYDDPVMQEEIFGPILPILTFDRFEDLYGQLADRPKPLALYLFSEDRIRIREAVSRFRFGGGCVNDVVIHLATSGMGFGGVGESGMGAYHGRAGFEAFSHSKSIVDKKTWMDLPMRYQPYQKKLYGKLLHMFLK